MPNRAAGREPARASVPDQPGLAWPGPAWPGTARFSKRFECNAKVSYLVKAIWSELFLGRVKKSHSAAEARTLILTANVRGCHWASRAWVIHGGCEDGVLKVRLSRRRNDRFRRSRPKVCVSCRRIKSFSEACQIERLARSRPEAQTSHRPSHSPTTDQPQTSHGPAAAQPQPHHSP